MILTHRVSRFPLKNSKELDRWALAKFEELKKRIFKSYEAYEFHAIYQGLNYFCGMTMSAFYLDILKDRLYTSGTDSNSRRAAQSVLYEIVDGLLRLMSPILCFTASEAWDVLNNRDQEADLSGTIFFKDFPEQNDDNLLDDETQARWDRLMGVRSEITRALENGRSPKKSSVIHWRQNFCSPRPANWPISSRPTSRCSRKYRLSLNSK